MMNQSQNSRSQSDARRQRVVAAMILTAALIGAALGAVIGLDIVSPRFDLREYDLALAVVLVVLFIALFVANIVYWRAIDEMARRAHLEAWFWGGFVSMSVFALSVAILALTSPHVAIFVDAFETREAFLFGGLAMFAAGLTGYSAYWLWYWGKTR
jgi:hypothetical protein